MTYIIFRILSKPAKFLLIKQNGIPPKNLIDEGTQKISFITFDRIIANTRNQLKNGPIKFTTIINHILKDD
jgi:hypothetical protein